jgi:DNA-binding transcriptional LysR family regulator
MRSACSAWPTKPRSELRSGRADGRVRIGSLESTAGSRLAPILSRFHRLHPGVVVELVTGTTGALLQRVAKLRDRGRVRVGAVHAPALDRARCSRRNWC